MTDNLSGVAVRESKIIYLTQPLYLLQRVRISVEPLKLVVNGASLRAGTSLSFDGDVGLTTGGRSIRSPLIFLLSFTEWRVNGKRMNTSADISYKQDISFTYVERSAKIRGINWFVTILLVITFARGIFYKDSSLYKFPYFYLWIQLQNKRKAKYSWVFLFI